MLEWKRVQSITHEDEGCRVEALVLDYDTLASTEPAGASERIGHGAYEDVDLFRLRCVRGMCAQLLIRTGTSNSSVSPRPVFPTTPKL